MFIYYCALCGGWAAFFGWMFAQMGLSLMGAQGLVFQAFMGMSVGFWIALGLSLVDAAWNLSLKQIADIGMRVGVAVLVGALGGLMGGLIGQAMVDVLKNLLKNSAALADILGAVLQVLAWTGTGFLIGASVGVLELIMSLATKKDVQGATKKEIKAVIGGTVGGLLGGFLALMFILAWGRIFSGKTGLWSPYATGFVALGMCIGLLIGLAQVILKEAWIRVESGFRPGREKILSKEKTTVGRAESCDIGLFGDPGVEKLHAQIIQSGNRYFLEDVGTPGGTFLNDQRVVGRMPLRSGDFIRLGKNVLCFRESKKRSA
jgi:hypothetical protein